MELGTVFSPAELELAHFTPAPGSTAEARENWGVGVQGRHLRAHLRALISGSDVPSHGTALETDCVIMIIITHAKQTF